MGWRSRPRPAPYNRCIHPCSRWSSGIVEFAECVAHLHAGDEILSKRSTELGSSGVFLANGTDLDGVVQHESRLDQIRLDVIAEQVDQPAAVAGCLGVMPLRRASRRASSRRSGTGRSRDQRIR